MKIKKVRFEGYKRFHDLTIDLSEEPKKIIALVGPNGCGKSCVLDGLIYCNNAFGKLGNKRTKGYEYHSLSQEPKYNWQKIHIFFMEGDFQTVKRQLATSGKQHTIFSFRSPYRYNSDLKVKHSKAMTEISLNDYGATATIDIDDKMEENYRRLNIKYNEYMHKEDCKPSEAKRHIIGELNSAIMNCLELEIVNLGNIESGQGTLFFRKQDCPYEFEFNVLSSGEKEVVDILLDLYLRKEEYSNSVFLIDEPELHIHTAIQKKLLMEINRLINENCQIWIATHSIGFLRALQDDFRDDCQVIEFKQENNWASEQYILYPIKMNRSSWMRLFKTALDDLTELISPRRIIYCEGRDLPGIDGKERGLDAKVFNNIFSEKYFDTVFVSSGGNTELDQRSEIALAILSKVFSGVEILVLKDRDISSGQLNTERDRQIYLNNNPRSHRVLKRWEIENYLFDKEILGKYCKINGLEFDEVEFDRFTGDVVNQNLKDEIGRIKNFCNIRTSISAEQFKLNLALCFSEDMPVYKELEECIFERL